MMAYSEVSGEAAYYTVIHTSLCKLYNVHRVQLYDIQRLRGKLQTNERAGTLLCDSASFFESLTS